MKNILLALLLGLVFLLVYLAIGGGHTTKMMHEMHQGDATGAMGTTTGPELSKTVEVPAAGVAGAHDHASHGTAESHAAEAAAHAAGNAADGAAGSHAHSPIDVADLPSRPDLEIAVLRDSMSGWNLHITTTNFTFTPASVGTQDVVGEGHAHVYVNGVKLGRVYSHWYHLPSLPKGTHHIEVTLNANSHGVYAIGDRPVSRKITVVER